MNLRKELLIVLGVVLVGWMVLMAGLARWQRSRAVQRVTTEPELIHYPGTEGAEEQTSPNMSFRKYWFKLNEDYPSLSVFYFYQKQLEPKGWKLMTKGAPAWVQQQEKDKLVDVFRAVWMDPKGLFQLDLEMASTVRLAKHDLGMETQDREPGIKVYVTLRRSLLPGMLMPPEEAAPSRGEIEVR